MNSEKIAVYREETRNHLTNELLKFRLDRCKNEKNVQNTYNSVKPGDKKPFFVGVLIIIYSLQQGVLANNRVENFSSKAPGMYDVMDFGAAGDSITDDTSAFQIALEFDRGGCY